MNSIKSSIQSYIKNKQSPHKKNDDYRIGFSQNKQSKSFTLFSIIATISIIFLIIICGGYMFFGSSSTYKQSNSNFKTARNRRKRKWGRYPQTPKPKPKPAQAKNNVNSANSDNAKKTLDDLLAFMKNYKHLPFELKQEDKLNKDHIKAIDMKMNYLIDEYCIGTLPFTLSQDARTTLNAHLQFAFESLMEEYQGIFPDWRVKNVAITRDGTIIDKSKDSSSGYRRENFDFSYKCPLIKSIVVKAKELNLLTPNLETNEFAFTDSDIWNEKKYDLFSSGNVNIDTFNLLSLVKENAHDLHKADQLIFELLKSHCSSAIKFVMDNHSKSGSATGDSRFTADSAKSIKLVTNIMDILRQIHKKGEIEIHTGEIPAFDSDGNVVAIDALKIDHAKEEYATCSLLDKLVYYRNAGISDQVVNALASLRESNIYAFETKMDILMEEHCSSIVRSLEQKPVKLHAHREEFAYSVFRDELLGFGTAINEHGFIENAEEFVITITGGMMNYDVARQRYSTGQIFKCNIITEMAKNAIKKTQKTTKTHIIEEHEFDPDIKNEKLEKEMEYIEDHISPNISDEMYEMMAKVILGHAMNEDHHHNLRTLLREIIGGIHKNDIKEIDYDHLLLQIEQVAVMIINGELQTELKLNSWPSTYIGAIDKASSTVVIEDTASDNYAEIKNGIIQSKLLTAMFRIGASTKNLKEELRSDPFMSKFIKNHENQNQNNGNQQNQQNANAQRDNQQKQDVPKNTEQHQSNNNQQTQQQQNNDKNNGDELVRYVELVWNDIKNQGVDAVRNDIYQDLDEHCANIMKQLNGHNQKKMKMNLINILNKKTRMDKPVILVNDGSIIGVKDVDHNSQFLNCPYITHLLAYQA